ncbi:hypothetical protein MPSEU_000050800 [Mayamaea pseudoterrestris]|nr:hypothetical protein MPSEU_000050800 [Mayamaea pseudoterrestris]
MTIGDPSSPARRSLLSNVCRQRSASFDQAELLDASLLNMKVVSNPLNSSPIARQVSHDGLMCISIVDKKIANGGPKSPVRCVSEFDKVSSVPLAVKVSDSSSSKLLKHESVGTTEQERSSIAPAANAAQASRTSRFPNPLHNPKLYELHIRAVRLEAELHPMRLILARLMNNTSLNRKGVFNSPVDPVALNLPDYFEVISQPMDFGTIKRKLHAIAYTSLQEVDADIRLVLGNAMLYNPSNNLVHVSAQKLLAFYEGECQAFVPQLIKDDLMQTGPAIEVVPGPLDAAEPEVSADSDATDFAMQVAPAPLNALNSQVPDDVLGPISSQPSIPSHIADTSCHSAAAPVHIHAAAKTCRQELAPRRRRKRGTRPSAEHACDTCEGRTCVVCLQKCLMLEPTLLICNGAACAGSRIRKNAVYYIASDGSRQFCQRCHTSLPAILPPTGQDDIVRYKRDLLKRKNDEEIAERWLQCTVCESPVHQMCVMHDEYVHREAGFTCPSCVHESWMSTISPDSTSSLTSPDELYTFVSGSEIPVKLSKVTCGDSVDLSAEALPENEVSSFIQEKVRAQMKLSNIPNVENTVIVRIISDCDRYFVVPDVIRNHFRMVLSNDDTAPMKINYRSKAIALFQKIDGLDVCIFCMYVHEYDGDNGVDAMNQVGEAQKKRVYIAYLDSVEHFRPRACRTRVYQEILVAYLATARRRGYENAHIWACPPSRGNSFVFWNHPASQRTPNKDRLVAWYHNALSRALECGVVTDVKSLFESNFEEQLREVNSSDCSAASIACPPLLDGDFWIEEAVRLHRLNMSRQMKPKTCDTDLAPAIVDGSSHSCPAMQIASLLRERVIAHPSALPFRKPVNAVALKLKDYHQVIATPMDLGSVFSRCMLGEYLTLGDIVSDVELVFSNAKLYNPVGHIVHMKAIEVHELFLQALNDHVATWKEAFGCQIEAKPAWKSFAHVSMSLNESLDEAAEGISKENDGGVVAFTAHLELSMTSEAINLLSGGPAAVEQRMVGSDTWLLDKNSVKPKPDLVKPGSRRRKGASELDDEPASKRRRQSWLSFEVGESVRRMRASFFTCSLTPSADMKDEEAEKAEMFAVYASTFSCVNEQQARHAKIADVRHALMEFSQFRNLEFDTVRHSKYSTAVILYHLHNDDNAGIVPACSKCGTTGFGDIRWHKLSKIVQRRSRTQIKAGQAKPSSFPEELCTSCFTNHSYKDNFIPVQVSVPLLD